MSCDRDRPGRARELRPTEWRDLRATKRHEPRARPPAIPPQRRQRPISAPGRIRLLVFSKMASYRMTPKIAATGDHGKTASMRRSMSAALLPIAGHCIGTLPEATAVALIHDPARPAARVAAVIPRLPAVCARMTSRQPAGERAYFFSAPGAASVPPRCPFQAVSFRRWWEPASGCRVWRVGVRLVAAAVVGFQSVDCLLRRRVVASGRVR